MNHSKRVCKTQTASLRDSSDMDRVWLVPRIGGVGWWSQAEIEAFDLSGHKKDTSQMYVYVFLTKTNAILNHEKICLKNQLLFALNFFITIWKAKKMYIAQKWNKPGASRYPFLLPPVT